MSLFGQFEDICPGIELVFGLSPFISIFWRVLCGEGSLSQLKVGACFPITKEGIFLIGCRVEYDSSP